MPGLFQVGVALLFCENEKIFIAKRSSGRDFGSELWELPSGRIEQNEGIINAIKREGLEELGVDVSPVSLINAYTFQRGKYELVLLTYHCNFLGSLTLSSEHSEGKWVMPDEAIKHFKFDIQKQSIIHFQNQRNN